jgi:hypothetical protein
MKNKKMNTIPNGEIIVYILFFQLIFNLVGAIILIPKPESIGLIVLSFPFVLALFDYISTKHFNFIFVSSDEVWHKNEKYAWQDVFITMKHSRPRFSRNSFDYYFYFSDHYLTEEEIKAKELKKKGFYIVLTKNRAEYLLPLYRKEVKVLSESPYAQKILDIVVNHNGLFSKNECI